MAAEHPGGMLLIALGIIRKPIGLKGECAVEAFGGTLKMISLPSAIYLGTAEKNCHLYKLLSAEFRSKGPVCSFEAVKSREDAEVLRNCFIYLAASSLPKLDKDSYYHFELIGLKVQTDNGQELGKCVNVFNYPSVDSIEVLSRSGITIMIPLTAEAVTDIDWKSGYLTVCQAFIEELI